MNSVKFPTPLRPFVTKDVLVETYEVRVRASPSRLPFTHSQVVSAAQEGLSLRGVWSRLTVGGRVARREEPGPAFRLAGSLLCQLYLILVFPYTYKKPE